jgi:AAA family ATP:ADP antiporter
MTVIKVYGDLYPNPMQEEENVLKEPGHSRILDENINMGDSKLTDGPWTSTFEIVVRFLDKYLSGVFLILEHNYLLLILGVSCLHEVTLTCLDYEMKLIGLAKYDQGQSFTTFMGRYGQLTNVLSFLLSYFTFPYLMKRYGVKLTLLIFPALLLVVNVLTFIAVPENLTVLFVSLSLLKAMTYSINEPTHEILYIPTSNVVKFKAKFWIDIVGARIAKAFGSVINSYAGSVHRLVRYGSLPSIITGLILFVTCYAVGIEFESLTQFSIHQ